MECNFLVKQQVKRQRKKKKRKPLHSLTEKKDWIKRGPVKKATLQLRIMEVKTLLGRVLQKKTVVVTVHLNAGLMERNVTENKANHMKDFTKCIVETALQNCLQIQAMKRKIGVAKTWSPAV